MAYSSYLTCLSKKAGKRKKWHDEGGKRGKGKRGVCERGW